MQRFTYFSRHAFKRLSQRTHLTVDEAAMLLDEKRYVMAGLAPASETEHLVFYSQRDESCYVAVRNRLSGKVITIWPLEYQANLAWKITTKEIEKAKLLAPTEQQPCKADFAPVRKPCGNARFLVSMHYNDSEGNPKARRLFSVDPSLYEGDIRALIADPALFRLASSRAEVLGVTSESIVWLAIRHGGSLKKTPVIIDWSERDDSL